MPLLFRSTRKRRNQAGRHTGHDDRDGMTHALPSPFHVWPSHCNRGLPWRADFVNDV